jgi:hypothetical protein
VHLEARDDGIVGVRANFPAEDVWDADLTAMDSDDLDRLVEAIDAVEAEFGDLVGYCEGCGVPPTTYRDMRA